MISKTNISTYWAPFMSCYLFDALLPAGPFDELIAAGLFYELLSVGLVDYGNNLL